MKLSVTMSQCETNFKSSNKDLPNISKTCKEHKNNKRFGLFLSKKLNYSDLNKQ